MSRKRPSNERESLARLVVSGAVLSEAQRRRIADLLRHDGRAGRPRHIVPALNNIALSIDEVIDQYRGSSDPRKDGLLAWARENNWTLATADKRYRESVLANWDYYERLKGDIDKRVRAGEELPKVIAAVALEEGSTATIIERRYEIAERGRKQGRPRRKRTEK